MSRFTKQMSSYRQQLRSVMGNELRTIFGDEGVLLVLVLALLIYATVYSLAYGSQVLRNVPIGVIDDCSTSTSRSLVEAFDAGPNTVVAYEPTDMQEAERLFFDRKIYGVVYIPSDYEQNLLGGLQANVAIYCDASYFLMYRQVFQELVTTIGATGAMVEFQRLVAKGANIPQAQATTQPVIYQSHNQFNPYLGYGAFAMPAIIMVIIQQTLLIGIGMIGGTWREFGLYSKLRPAGRRRMSTLPIVLGRGLVYAAIYGVTCTYIPRTALQAFPFPDERNDGRRARIHGGLSGGLHRTGTRRLDAVPLPREFAPAAALDLDTAADVERRVVPARRHSRLALRLRADLPEQPRRGGLHPRAVDGRLAGRGAARDQGAADARRDLRRTGVHRYPLRAQTRGARAGGTRGNGITPLRPQPPPAGPQLQRTASKGSVE